MKRITALCALMALSASAQQVGAPVKYVYGMTVASLPSASNAKNEYWAVFDGASGTDCSTGGGSTQVVCYSNGSTWTSTTSSGGSGDTITSPNSTLTVGGTATHTTLDFNLSNPNTWTGTQTFVAPALGTPASGVATNLTGTASGLSIGGNAATATSATSATTATTATNATNVASVLVSANVTNYCALFASNSSTNQAANVATGCTFNPSTNTLTAAILNATTSIGVGTAPTACGSATGCIGATEASTAGTPTASQDYCRADSTAHAFKCSLNNGSEFTSAMNFTTGANTWLDTQTISPSNTAHIALVANNASGTSVDIFEAQINGTKDAWIGSTDPGEAHFGPTSPLFTAGTAGVTVGSGCGAAPTGLPNTSLFYCNLANFQDEITQTSDLGSVVAESTIVPANVLLMGSGITPQAIPSHINDNNGYITSTEVAQFGNTKTLTADSGNIVATTAATAITQFSWATLPSNTHFSFSCEGTYTQATAAGGVSIAIQGATTAPTRIDAWATLYSTNPASTTITGTKAGLFNLATTTYTLVAAVTPGAATTQYQWELHGTIQTGNPGSTLNIGFFSGSASDAVVIKNGSYCTLHY